jgi:hypothetical protein
MTRDQVIGRTIALIDRARADAIRAMITNMIMRGEDDAFISDAVQAAHEWNREQGGSRQIAEAAVLALHPPESPG